MDLCYDLLRGGIVTSLDLCARGISFVSTLPSWLEKGSQHLPNWSHNWEGIANWTLEAKNSIEQVDR